MTGSTPDRNQGEGDRASARRFSESAERFAKQGPVEKAAEKARQARSGPEKKELDRAEREGREAAKEHDPAVRRDYSRPQN